MGRGESRPSSHPTTPRDKSPAGSTVPSTASRFKKPGKNKIRQQDDERRTPVPDRVAHSPAAVVQLSPETSGLSSVASTGNTQSRCSPRPDKAGRLVRHAAPKNDEVPLPLIVGALKEELQGQGMRQLIRDEVGHALKEHLAEVPISFPAVAAAGDNSDKCTDAPGPTEAADGAADITHRIMRKASQAEQPEDVIGVHTAAEALRELMKHSNKSEKSLVKSSYRRILSLLRHWNEIEEPQKDRLIDRVVRSSQFATVCGFVIALNAAFMMVSTDYEVANPGKPNATLRAIEYAFIAWYFVELVMKLASHGLYFFAGPDCSWNVFDLALVAFSGVQLVIETGAGGSLNVSVARTMRLFKISKVFRLLRFLEFMKDVKLMMYCMISSLFAVFWGLVMIVFLLFLFSIIILQAVILYQGTSPNESDADYKTLLDTFSSVGSTMFVLFQATSGGRDWMDAYTTLGIADMWWAQATYLVFIVFFAIAVWNIVTSVFIEKAIAMSEPDKELIMLRKRRSEVQDVHELRHIFEALDVNHSNTLTPLEFERVMTVPEFQHFLDSRGIHIKDVGTFFAMIAQSVGANAEIEIDTMVACCMRIKGMATSIDLHTLRFEVKAALAENRRLLGELTQWKLGRTSTASA